MSAKRNGNNILEWTASSYYHKKTIVAGRLINVHHKNLLEATCLF